MFAAKFITKLPIQSNPVYGGEAALFTLFWPFNDWILALRRMNRKSKCRLEAGDTVGTHKGQRMFCIFAAVCYNPTFANGFLPDETVSIIEGYF